MLNLGHFPTERLASSSLLGSCDRSVTSVKLTNVKREAPLTVDCRSALYSCKCGKAKEEYCFDSFPLNHHPYLKSHEREQTEFDWGATCGQSVPQNAIFLDVRLVA